MVSQRMFIHLNSKQSPPSISAVMKLTLVVTVLVSSFLRSFGGKHLFCRAEPFSGGNTRTIYSRI